MRGIAEFYLQQGAAQHKAGNVAEAAELWRKGFETTPDHDGIGWNLGVALKQLGRWAEAERVWQQVTALWPGHGMAWFNLAVARNHQGKDEATSDAYRHAARLMPDHWETHWNLGITLKRRQAWVEGAAVWRVVTALKPGDLEAWRNLGMMLTGLKRHREAIPVWRRVLVQEPGNKTVFGNIALGEYQEGRLEEATATWAECLRHHPQDAQLWSNLAVCLKNLLRIDEARSAFRCALALDPANPELRYNHALFLMLTGKLSDGSRQYEARYETAHPVDHYLAGRLKEIRQPRWNGQSGSDIVLLLHAEQGLGDTIQYIRFAEPIRERVGHVIVACQRPLYGLLEKLPGIDCLMLRDDPLPDFTHYAPLLSVKHLLGVTPADLVPRSPYLRANPEKVAAWRARLSSAQGLKVGLVWAGSPIHAGDAQRSLSLPVAAPLLSLEGISLFSLQKGPRAVDIAVAGCGDRLPSLVGEDSELTDTAAMMMALDLVITVDTAMAHLAGALGRPVWTLLPYAPDWRWLLGREDSPWYPTMRLFRQSRRGDWPGVIERVGAALRTLVARTERSVDFGSH